MKERAEMLQGWLTIDSKPGEGTRVRLNFPLNRQNLDK
ncbi:Signal transduction histidine kinase, nitrate /nitrite-specific [Serratia rubidaea]|nr:Signal transduction histidine kinase, nitrate /nitrite-specific [Serratia rubidaea]